MVVDLACAEAKLGHEVHVASLDGTYVELLSSYGVHHHEIDFTRRRPVAMLRAYQQLRRLVADLEVDIVHSHVLAATAVARSAHPRVPLVATVHNEWQRGVRLMGLAHAVVGVSQAVTSAMRARGVSATRLHTVYNGTSESPRRANTQQAPPRELKSPAIVTLGSVSRRKGADVLFEAFIRVLEDLPTANLYSLRQSRLVGIRRTSSCVLPSVRVCISRAFKRIPSRTLHLPTCLPSHPGESRWGWRCWRLCKRVAPSWPQQWRASRRSWTTGGVACSYPLKTLLL